MSHSVAIAPELVGVADAPVPPPARSREPLLPFASLTPLGFERLCLVLAQRDTDVEYAQRYGNAGQRQAGIDLYGRTADGRYRAYQAKRYARFEPADIRAAVTEFLEGKWAPSSETFVLCTSASAVTTQRADAIEEQAKVLMDRGIGFEVWDAEVLSQKLKALPVVVLDFFDRPWVEAFCTSPLPSSANDRLGPADLVRLRRRLERFYSQLFGRHRGLLPHGATATIDQEVLRRRVPEPRDRRADHEQTQSPRPTTDDSADVLVSERLSWVTWLSGTRTALLTGPAGSGKSTLLRALCSELLSDAPALDNLAADWRTGLPIWLPFGPWAARVQQGGPSSLEHAVRAFFDSYDEADLGELAAQALCDERVVLIVDGLDEWLDEDGARIAADRLQQVIGMRGLRAVLSGRPEALLLLGPLEPSWSRAQLAPLAEPQASELLTRYGADPAGARRLVGQLSQTGSLRQLATNPLLLVLAWRTFGSERQLPTTRAAAMSQMVDDFLIHHPAQRQAAGGPPATPLGMTGADVRFVLEDLALRVAHNGPTPLRLETARETVAAALRSRSYGGDEALRLGRELLRVAARSIGIISDDQAGVVFAHRALQEDLAGRAVARLPRRDRHALLVERARSPAWRDTVLAALSSIDEGSAVADALKEIRTNGGLRERWSTAPLLALAAVRVSLCPSELRSELIESATDLASSRLAHPHRDPIVDALTEGLASPDVRHAVIPHVKNWIPNRLAWAGGVWTAMQGWTSDRGRVDQVLFNALGHDHTTIARRAADALFARPPAWLGERLIARLGDVISSGERVNALYLATRHCPTEPHLERLVARARRSEHVPLRIVALAHCVARGQRGEDELNELLALAGDNSLRANDYEHLVGHALRDGWPDDPRIRDPALKSIGMAPRCMEITTASFLLLSGYVDDPDVTQWILRELATDHPFVTVDDIVAYRLLRPHAHANAAIAAAVDRKQHTLSTAFSTAIYAASLATRSEAAKGHLLQLLAEPNRFGLGWIVRALREGWPDDPDAKATLQALAETDAGAEVADQLDDVVGESGVDDWLLAALHNPANASPASAARAINKRAPSAREAGLAAALARTDYGRAAESLLDTLIGEFADLPTGRHLALTHRYSPTVSVAALASAGRYVPELRPELLGIAEALSLQPRLRFAERLYDRVAPESLTCHLTRHWDLETSTAPASAAAAARAAYRRDGPDAMGDKAVATIREGGALATARVHAALAVLIELDQVEKFADLRLGSNPSEPINIELDEVLDPNRWLSAHVARHWSRLTSALDDPVARLSRFGKGSAWLLIAPFAAPYPTCRDDCLRYIREEGLQGRPELLRFLARVRPRSSELLHALIEAVDGKAPSDNPGLDSILTGAELLSEHFGSADGEAPEALLDRVSTNRPSPGVLLALASGWPRSAALRDLVEATRNEEPWLHPDIAFRLHVVLAPPREAAEALDSQLQDAMHRIPHLPPIPAALSQRVARDAAFRSELEHRLGPHGTPGQWATISRVLASVGRLDGATRTAVETECSRSLEGSDTDLLAVDLVANEVRPLGIALWDALEGDAT